MNIAALLLVGLYYFARRNVWNFLVIFVLVAITGLALYQSALDASTVDGNWWSGMWQNFATEMIGAILTFALFEMLINANNRQETLIRQMGSGDNATALNAVNELRADGYLFDGTLQGKTLENASLTGANLVDANLSGTRLRNTDLSDAKLMNANLEGADLRYANLENATLLNAHFDSKTILPDEQHWHPAIDMTVYTAPPVIEEVIEAQSDVPDLLTISPLEIETPPEIKRPQSHPYRALRAKRRKKSFT